MNEKQPVEQTSSIKHRKAMLIALALLCGVGIITALGYGGTRLYSSLTEKKSPGITQHQSLPDDGNKIITKEEGDIAGVVEKVGPSVVSIITKEQGNSLYGNMLEQEGAGTGIIVGKEGYILTNKHVVSGVSQVDVVLSDGTRYDKVKVLGVDPLNDVAFLKIEDVKDLPAATLGDSSSIRVGQRVVAIGNSLGQYQNTVTSGIISGMGRPVLAQAGETVENLSDLIQTDAAINPGNSGGPLLNLNGQVIGINTAIIENAQGIGFSIPINATKGILKGVLSKGVVERSYLGVNFIPITPDIAKEFNLSVKKGAYIQGQNGKSAVVSGGPAEKAGVKNGDIIIKVGGVEVGVGGGISSLVSEYAPGDTIEITVLRGNETLVLRVTLAAYAA